MLGWRGMAGRAKRLTDAERRASYDRASAISDRLETALGYRGVMADFQRQRMEVSYEVMDQLLDAYDLLVARGERDE